MWRILLSYETFLHLDCGVNVVSTCEAKYIGIEKREERAGEKDQHLEALTVLAKIREDPSSVPSTICHSSSGESHALFWPPQVPKHTCKYTHTWRGEGLARERGREEQRRKERERNRESHTHKEYINKQML